MTDAATPRWRGQPGRLEVWYASATDTATGTGLWLHHELVSPTHGAPYAHGWLTVFAPDAPPRLERFGPHPVSPLRGTDWLTTPTWSAGPGRLWGATAAASWDLAVHGDERPLWTFPRRAWRRELLPSAQVVVTPRATLTGTVEIDGLVAPVTALGNIAHIYGHGNAQRWGWLHADLDDDTVLEVVAAVGRRPGLNSLPPLAFVQLRQGGRDWPRHPLLAAPLFRTRLHAPTWTVRGIVGTRRLSVTVHQPRDRCVAVGYVDPDGDRATCTNTERADVHVRLERFRGRWIAEREWSLDGTAHAELGDRP